MAIVEQQKNKVAQSEKFESNNFSIHQSPEVFAILSDQLYSDKIKAVIRELSTNAVDSVIEAKTFDRGYDVFLPDSLNPYFYIRDYGTGLSHEDCMGLFATYFGSTKTDSNDYTGQFGLGSKSPFAYTDNFTIVSYKDGIQRTYTACINEDNYPEIKFLDECETTEHNGIKIQFAVKNYDCSEFNAKASGVYKWFDYKPNVINSNDDWEIKEIKHVLGEEKDWLITGQRYDDPIVVMGDIAYPINNLPEQKEFDDTYRSILNGLVLYFDVGELKPTPSRESISLKSRDVIKICEKIKCVVSQLKGYISRKFDNCDSLWDARLLSKSLFNSFQSPLHHIGSMFSSGDFTYEGHNITHDRISSNWSELSHLRDEEDIARFKIYKFTTYSDKRSRHLANAKKSRKDSFKVDERFEFFEDDLDRGGNARLKKYAEETQKPVYLLSFDSDETRTQFMDKVGFLDSHISVTSDLPAPNRTSYRSGSGVRKEKVFQLDCVFPSETNRSECWDSTIVDVNNDEGIYVEINRYNILCLDGREISAYEVCKEIIEPLYDGLFSLKHDMPEKYLDEREGRKHRLKIHGVKKSASKKYKVSENWIKFFDLIEKLLVEEKSELLRTIDKSTKAHDSLGLVDTFFKFIKQEGDSFGSKYSKALNELINIKDSANTNEMKSIKLFLMNIKYKAGMDISIETDALISRERMEHLEKQLFSKYPVLKGLYAIPDYYRPSEEIDFKIWQDYVDLLDSIN